MQYLVMGHIVTSSDSVMSYVRSDARRAQAANGIKYDALMSDVSCYSFRQGGECNTMELALTLWFMIKVVFLWGKDEECYIMEWALMLWCLMSVVWFCEARRGSATIELALTLLRLVSVAILWGKEGECYTLELALILWWLMSVVTVWGEEGNVTQLN